MYLQTPKNWPSLHPSAGKETVRSNPVEGVDYPPNRMIPGRKGKVDLGKPPNFPSFGWDNEYGERSIDVPDFLASEHMITNGEYWEFVADGGYRSKKFWCDDGWAWRVFRNMKWPFFWQPAGPAVSCHTYTLMNVASSLMTNTGSFSLCRDRTNIPCVQFSSSFPCLGTGPLM